MPDKGLGSERVVYFTRLAAQAIQDASVPLKVVEYALLDLEVGYSGSIKVGNEYVFVVAHRDHINVRCDTEGSEK